MYGMYIPEAGSFKTKVAELGKLGRSNPSIANRSMRSWQACTCSVRLQSGSVIVVCIEFQKLSLLGRLSIPRRGAPARSLRETRAAILNGDLDFSRARRCRAGGQETDKCDCLYRGPSMRWMCGYLFISFAPTCSLIAV